MKKSGLILIVDDEQNLRTSLGLILQKAGYRVEMASNAEDGADQLRSKRFDLIFLDLRMPGMDGLEALPKFLHIQPDIPVLILTANSSLDIAIKTLTAGAVGYLLKPVDPGQILIRVREVLSEVEQSRRRKEILREMSGIIGELRQIEGY